MKKGTLYLVEAAMIAAIYVVLTYIFQPLSFNDVQVRFAEALTVLPLFTPAAIPGLFVGCFLGNLLGGAALLDVIAGSLTTLAAAYCSYLFRKNKFLVPVFPIVFNAIVVPWVLRYAYGIVVPIPFMMLTVGLGEVISCGVIGGILMTALQPVKHHIFKHKYI